MSDHTLDGEVQPAQPPVAHRSKVGWIIFSLLLAVISGAAGYHLGQMNPVHNEPSITAIDSSPTPDPCATLRDTDPHCGWKPHWDESAVSINKIDGKKTQFLSLESSDADGADFGHLHYAVLRLCFEDDKLCGGTSIKVGVTVNGMVDPSSGSEYSTSVRLRFDDEQPHGQTWGIADSHDALFPSGREKEFITALRQHKKLFLEFSYYERSPRTVTFDLAGLNEKLTALSLTL